MIAFPEGTTALVTDDEARSLKKWNQLWYNTYGNVGTVPYPEGTEPLPSDDEHRSTVKLQAIKKAVEADVCGDLPAMDVPTVDDVSLGGNYQIGDTVVLRSIGRITISGQTCSSTPTDSAPFAVDANNETIFWLLGDLHSYTTIRVERNKNGAGFTEYQDLDPGTLGDFVDHGTGWLAL